MWAYPPQPPGAGGDLGEVAVFSRGQFPERDSAVSRQQPNSQQLEK